MPKQQARVRRGFIAASLVAALTLSGCGGTEPESQTAGTGSESAPVSTQSDGSRLQAGGSPSLVINTISGGQVDFADLLGQDTVLWFWAPW